jgi:glycerol-3-phosphate O-acyltransferase
MAESRPAGPLETIRSAATSGIRAAAGRGARPPVGQEAEVARVVAELRSNPRFRASLEALATEVGRPEREVANEVAGSLREMVSTHGPVAVETWERFGNLLTSAGTIEVDEQGIEELRRLSQKHSLVFLPSHRSYIDPFILAAALHKHGFPPNYVLAGANLNFWPLGPLARRSGNVMIRRTVKDNPVYRFTLREYIGHLVRTRRNLEWFIEGTRTRSGKMRPPRYGILNYLVEAFRESADVDVILAPVSIVYEHLHEVEAMAAEERGGQKRPESFRFMVRYIRDQRRRPSKVHLRLGEPLSLREGLAAASIPDPSLTVEKLAFELCHRINRATPITSTSLVTLALLGAEDRAFTFGEVRDVLEPLLKYVAKRGLPLTGGDPYRSQGVLNTLDTLVRNKVVSRFAGGLEPVWAISPEKHVEAAFYRNAAIHFFVNRAIIELIGVGSERPEELWPWARDEAMRLRDLLKFEFFFAEKSEFEAELRQELDLVDPNWAAAEELATVWRELSASGLYLAHRVLGSSLDAYLVVAERLADRPAHLPIDEKQFVVECIGAAQQYLLQHRIVSGESVSKELLTTGLKLAQNRGLVTPGDNLDARRQAFVDEIRDLVRRVHEIRDLAFEDFRTGHRPPELRS